MPRKTPNGKIDKRDWGLNLASLVYQLLSAATAGVKTSMPYLGFEPGTSSVAAGSPSHYSAWSVKKNSGTVETAYLK